MAAVCAASEAVSGARAPAASEQLTADPALFRLPGDESGAAGFMETWTRVLRQQTTTAQERASESCEGPL
ncbi:hypothetical protein GCM10018782_52280 [Streptomyces griseoaurantiacus]|nr:hypothetical protein GCM10018782_52280 [Streptomyces griseoaurantiacus]